MNADAAVQAELQRLRRRVPLISGTVLAAVDGLLIASDLPGVDAHHVAALSAASIGIGSRFAQALGHGGLRESTVRGATGTVVSYPAGTQAILTVLAHPEAEVSGLHPEGRSAALRLGILWQALHGGAVTSAAPLAADPRGPLAVRTPMAALPANLWPESDGRRPPRRH